MEEQQKDEILQTDLETRPSIADKINMFVDENRKLVSWVSIGAVLLVVVVYFVTNSIKKSALENQEKAATALSRVLPLYNAKDPASMQIALYGDKTAKIRGEAVIGLVDIANKYEGSPEGKLSALYAANLFALQKKNGEAEKYFKIALESDSKLVVEGAYAGLGATQEAKGKYDEAIANYKKAVDNFTNFASKNRYEYFQGLCYEKLGKKDEAVKIYQGIIAENKTSEFIGRAKGGLVRLGTVIE
jgi:tetratricopeptide (TPR) repeat protein